MKVFTVFIRPIGLGFAIRGRGAPIDR